MPAASDVAIECSDLVIDRIGHGGITRAIDGVTFTLRPGDLICVGGATPGVPVEFGAPLGVCYARRVARSRGT